MKTDSYIWQSANFSLKQASERLEFLLSNLTRFLIDCFYTYMKVFDNRTWCVLTLVSKVSKLLHKKFFFLPAVMSFMSLKQFKPTICAASKTDRLSASVKKEGTCKQEGKESNLPRTHKIKHTNPSQPSVINSQQSS